MVDHSLRPAAPSGLLVERVGTDSPAKPLTAAGERILAAASALFYAHGLRAVGVDAIADAAEVTKKTLYDRFGSKDRLIAAYLENRNRLWHLFLDEQLAARRPSSPEEVILALFAALTDWMAESRRGCGFINASVELAAPDHPAIPVIVGQKRWMRAEFLAQAEQAGFQQCEELADRLLLLHEGALVSYQVAAMENAPEVAHRAAADLLASWPRTDALGGSVGAPRDGEADQAGDDHRDVPETGELLEHDR